MDTVKPFGWPEAIKLLDTHPTEHRTLSTTKLKFALTRLEKRPSNPNFAKFVKKELERVFPKNMITVHMFGGLTADHKSFDIHRDKMDVLYLQLFGAVNLSLWKPKGGFIPESDSIDEKNANQFYKKIFTYGNMIWIPRGTWHYIEPLQSSIRFSFGVEGHLDTSIYK